MLGLIKKFLSYACWGIATWVLGVAALITLGILVSVFFLNKLATHTSDNVAASVQPVEQHKSGERMASPPRALEEIQKEYALLSKQKEVLLATHLELAIAYKKNIRHRRDVSETLFLLGQKKSELQKTPPSFPLVIGGIRCNNQNEYELLIVRLEKLEQLCNSLLSEYAQNLSLINEKLEQIEPAAIQLNETLSALQREALSLKVDHITGISPGSSIGSNDSVVFLLSDLEYKIQNLKNNE